MSRKKNLIQLIKSLEKPEFDKIIKVYLREEYNFKKIIITDGKDDIGLDIRVFDFNQEKIQYQLTTQKSETTAQKNNFEKKLYEDLKKAKINFNKYGYSNKLIFFYSYEFTNKRIRDYEKHAFKEYGVNLELIEANRLADEAESIIEIQRKLYEISELDKFELDKSNFESEKENLVFDMLSFGKPSEFKLQIIEAFILKSLIDKESLTKKDIISNCEEKFKVEENNVFYNKLLNRLLTSKKICKSHDKLHFLISKNYSKNLKDKLDQHDLDEKLFVFNISKILDDYNQKDFLEDYILELKNIYVNNFNSDIKSLISDEHNGTLSSVIRRFKEFIQEKDNTIKEEDFAELIKKLLEYCLKNKFIQKIAASKVYSDNINDSRLERYLNTQKKIFIDTPIALYALCYFYKPKSNYNHYFYRITKSLIDFINRESLLLNISHQYILEIRNHIREAFYLLPFSYIDNFEKLGASKNVFYNFYLFLKTNEQVDYTFSSFLNKFGFNEGASNKSINSKIYSHLKEMNITGFDFEHEYDIEETNRIFDEKLYSSGKFKSNFTKNNDSIMLEFLAHDSIDVHSLKPLFITWDKTFYEVQKEYLKKFPNAQHWLMLSPSKLIDAYAILKFSIDSETVTENLLGLLSDDLVNNTHTLIDTIKFILDPEDIVSLEYTNELARIRQDEIHNINKKITDISLDVEGETVIDDVMFNLSNHFKQDENKFELFKLIFKKKEYMEDVLYNIEQTIKEFYRTKTIEQEIYNYFDSLVIALEDKI